MASGSDTAHMATAFTFPGQGSQTVGMGRSLAEAYPEARAVFDEVDEALGEKLSAIIWERKLDRPQASSPTSPRRLWNERSPPTASCTS